MSMGQIPDKPGNSEINTTGMRLVFSFLFPGENAGEYTDQEISQRLAKLSIGWKITAKDRKETAWYIDASPYLEIAQKGLRQEVRGRKNDPDLPSQYFFIRSGGPEEPPQFYRVPTSDLQAILENEYTRRLDRYDGISVHETYWLEPVLNLVRFTAPDRELMKK